MALSRERAVDLSHRILERLKSASGVQLVGEAEYVRNQVLRVLLDWDRENERLSAEAARRLRSRPRKVAEGSREWDLLFAEEMERLYAAFLARGE